MSGVLLEFYVHSHFKCSVSEITPSLSLITRKRVGEPGHKRQREGKADKAPIKQDRRLLGRNGRRKKGEEGKIGQEEEREENHTTNQ